MIVSLMQRDRRNIKEIQDSIVEIKFSRHAKRRAKLYKISESTILKILEGKELSQGDHEIREDIEGFKHPLKIVVTVEDDIINIITNYPLKKGKKG